MILRAKIFHCFHRNEMHQLFTYYVLIIHRLLHQFTYYLLII